MAEGSPQRPGSAAFTAPDQVNQRRYEAIRAWYVEGLTYQQAADRYGYTRWAMIDLVRQWRAGKLELFAPPRKPGPPPGTAPAKDRARARVIELRRQGLSTYEISARLATEHTPLNRTSVAEILTEEGFGRLVRRPEPKASISPGTAGRDTNLPAARVIDFNTWPARVDSTRAGLLLVLPDLATLNLPDLTRLAGYPGTRVIPAISWLLTLLVLKLTRTRRVSHVDDLLADPAAALLTGMATLPKKSALTSYSYRLSHDHQQQFLAALDTTMIARGLASSDQAIFDLDFHAVMHWGTDPVLEKHYVPTRSQRARSVLTFFAQDTGTHNLVYANADISKATQAREVIAFCDHWKAVSGKDPAMLIMDQKVTTHHVLGELDHRGVKFLTLRMRSPALIRHINALPPAAYTTVTLDRPGPYNKPRVHEDPHARLTDYPGTVRQLVVTGLGREAPTVIITNDRNATIRDLISRYARRMTIEQRLAEIIRAFCADALSSTVNLNVDLDIMLTVLAQALLAALRNRLPGYAAVTPDTIQRRFLETPGTIITTGHTITVRLERRAYTPVLRAADLPTDTRIPWLGNKTIRYELT
jgi:transposase